MKLKSYFPHDLDTLRNPEDYVFLSDGVKYWVGPVSDIVSVEQTDNYTNFSLRSGQKLMIRGVLGRWETKLPTSLFFKASRDCIVNLMHIKHLRAYDAKRLSFIMVNSDIEIILSREQSILFRKSKRL